MPSYCTAGAPTIPRTGRYLYGPPVDEGAPWARARTSAASSATVRQDDAPGGNAPPCHSPCRRSKVRRANAQGMQDDSVQKAALPGVPRQLCDLRPFAVSRNRRGVAGQGTEPHDSGCLWCATPRAGAGGRSGGRTTTTWSRRRGLLGFMAAQRGPDSPSSRNPSSQESCSDPIGSPEEMKEVVITIRQGLRKSLAGESCP
jgi:hypothetical protein